MKKLFILFLSLIGVLTLVGCKTTTTIKKYSILIPNGTPAIALTYIDFNKYDVTYVSGSDVLTSAFVSESYDFIVAPIQMGAKLYNLNQNYSMISVLVNCNYYLVSKDPIEINNLSSKSITLFGENTMPDIIAKYAFNKKGLSDLNITYVPSAQDAASSLMTSLTQVALLSEPQISSLESKLGALYTIDLASIFLMGETLEFIPQAALFVRGGLEEDAISAIKEEAKESIKNVTERPSAASAYMQTISVDGYNKMSEDILTSCISRASLKYSDAVEAKYDILSFFSILNNYNSNLLGGQVPDEFFR